MGLFSVTIRKSFQGYQWVNSYRVDAPEATPAAVGTNLGLPIVAAERAWHSNLVSFVNLHVALIPDPGRLAMINYPLGGTGELAIPLSDLPQAADAVFVQLASTEGGMPGKKFYRFSTPEQDYRPAGDRTEWIIGSIPALIAGEWETLLETADGLSWRIVIGASNRSVTSVSVPYVAKLDTHHGWYNRSEGA